MTLPTITLPLAIIITVLTGCDSDLEVATLKGSCAANCPKILKVDPPSGIAGDQVKLIGEKFVPGMTVLAQGIPATIQVISATEATMEVPEGLPGKVDLETQIGRNRTSGGSLYLMGSDHPLITADAELICEGIRFYDSVGALQEGTRDCSTPPVCTEDGQTDCVNTGRFKSVDTDTINSDTITKGTTLAGVAGTLELNAKATEDANLVASNIRSGVTIAGITGTLAPESHTNCDTNLATDCITTTTFRAADLTNLAATNIVAGTIIAGVTGNVVLPAVADVESGVQYGAAGTQFSGNFTVPAAINVATGIQYGNSGTEFTGSAGIEAHNNCLSDGATGCVATASFTAAATTGLANKVLSGQTVAGIGGNVTLPAASNVLTGSGTYGVAGTGSTPSYSPDFPAVSNVLSTDTVNGATGTLTLPAASNVLTGSGTYGVAGTGSTPSYSPDFPAVSNVLSTDTVNGATGTLPNCSANGAEACYITAGGTFDAADLSNLSAGNIKRGIAIAGTTGTYPSAATPLVRYANDGASTAETGSDINDLTNFITQMTSAGSFEFWDSAGVRYTGSGDADIANANVASGTSFENLSIIGSATVLTQCTSGVQATCESDISCRWNSGSCEINPWHIRKGITIAGQTGNIAFFKNMANTSLFNRTFGTGSSSGIDAYDTIEDLNNGGAFPTENPTGWDQATGANWTNITSTNTSYYDEITGLAWTADRGSTYSWESAISECEGLTYNGNSDWRLPTQKELLQAYTNGISAISGAMSISGANYWSATTRSTNTSKAKWVDIRRGASYTADDLKSNAYRVVCVTP